MGCTYLFSGDTWGSLHAALQTCSRGLLPLWSDDLGQARARALRPAECTVLACRHDLLPVLPTPSRKAVPQQRMHLGDPVRAAPPPRPPRARLSPLLCLSRCRRVASRSIVSGSFAAIIRFYGRHESSQDGEQEEQTEAPGSSLIYFDNCNVILIIYARASEFIGT